MAQLTDTLVSGDERVTGMIYGTQAGNYATCTEAGATKTANIPGFVLTVGVHVRIKFSANNTAATPTLNVSGTGAKSIKVKGGNLPTAGDLAANGVYEFVYDGTNWELTGAVPTSHTHGNIQNGGTLQTTDVAIANGDKLVITDSSDSNKVARASVSFDGSTTTKALTQKGTFEAFVSSIKKNGSTITPSDGVADIGYMPVTEAQATATVQEVIQALRVKPGGRMGSVLLNASTVSNTSIPAAWYNYIWIPHRTGAAADDNQNFGTLILTPMTNTPDVYVIEGSNLNTSSAAYRIKRLGNDASFLYANLAWGGAFRTSLSPFDNYAFKSANCFFGAKPSAIRVEYSTDGGTTWLDYGLTDAYKQMLLSQYGGVSVFCGKNTHIQPGYTGSIVGTKDLSDANIADQRLRITICDSSLANEGTTGSTDRWLYCTLRRIGIYMSTQSATAGVHCLFERRTSANFKSGTDTWVSEGDYKIQGDSGWNSIPCSNATTANGITFGVSDSQTREIRFTIWSDKLAATPAASQTGNLCIYKIVAYSENLWTNNSSNPNVANYGSPYTINPETGVTQFSKGITSGVAIPISSGGTGKTSVTSGNYLVGNGTGALTEKTPNAVGNNVLTSLATGDDNLIEGDYIIASNHTEGATDATKFVRRTADKLWNYIKDRISSVLGLTTTNYGGNAATATTATNYNTSSGNIKTELEGKSSTTHTHSVSINGNTKTIAASGGTAVDLGTYKVFNYARVYTTQTYNANTNRYIMLAFNAATYTSNWEESSMFKLEVHDGLLPKELVFRLWLKGNVGSDPSDPKLYRVYSENFSESALNILDVRLFVVEKSAESIQLTIGIFIDRNYLQGQYISYQLYPLSYATRDRGNEINSGLSNWTYTVGQDIYRSNNQHSVFTTAFEVNDLSVDMSATKAVKLSTARKLAVSLSNTSTDTSFDGSADVTNIKTTGTLPVSKGGTGRNSVAAGNYLVGNGTNALVEKTPNVAANDLINSLSVGEATPSGNDYYVSQYANGGTTTTSFHRRPISLLWEYMKSRISSVLGLTATNYGGNAATATTATKLSSYGGGEQQPVWFPSSGPNAGKPVALGTISHDNQTYINLGADRAYAAVAADTVDGVHLHIGYSAAESTVCFF